MSNQVYITGHKNPDTDSICSAVSYAYLKNQIDVDEKEYIAIRCGNLNKQTKFVFSFLKQEPPEVITDIRARVGSVIRKDSPVVTPNDTIYHAIEKLNANNLSVLPVIDNKAGFSGLLSIHELLGFLIHESQDDRPRYLFKRDNFEKVLPGFFLKRGEKQEYEVPLMIGAMPFDVSVERVNQITDVKPLLITGMRMDLISYAVENNFPGLILTGCEKEDLNLAVFENYRGSIFVSHTDTAETARRMRLSLPVKRIMNTHPTTVDADTFFDNAKDMLVNSSYRGLPVLKDNNFLGLVSRRCFIEKPKNKLILVDHNELKQSIQGASEAEIVEVIDHHRLGNNKTKYPIMMDIRPLGSTCSIVYDHYVQHDVEVPKNIAALLLSGILSDTVVLKSPTTTVFDRKAARKLAKIAELDIEQWGEKVLRNGSSLITDDYNSLILSDIKHYKEHGYSICIGQVEVVTFKDIESVKQKISVAMQNVLNEQKLDWILLLVTNIVKQDSLLLVSHNQALQSKLIYQEVSENMYFLKGVLSRKKQLLPEILRVIEETPKKTTV